MQISTKGNGNLGRVIQGLSQLDYTVAFAFHTVIYDNQCMILIPSNKTI